MPAGLSEATSGLRMSRRAYTSPFLNSLGEWIILTCLSNLHRAEARRVLHAPSRSDEYEKEYLLEYYSLVREGKTNFISTLGFHAVTGTHPTEPQIAFKRYVEELLSVHSDKKRKIGKEREK